MWDPFPFEARTNHRVSTLCLFSLFVAGHLLVIFLLLYFFFPKTWERELNQGLVSITVTFLSCHLAFCIGEYFFHRYILHDVVAGLKVFFQKHRTHHSLTAVSWGKDNGKLKIRSAYAIEKTAQDDSSTFPWWALTAFLIGFTPLLILVSEMFSSLPIFWGGYSALALTYYLYEALHSLHHQSYAWWSKKLSKPLFGKVWQALYSFHNCHHANTRCNLNVAGFFGFPLADWIFGTYRSPDILLLDGQLTDLRTVSDLTSKSHWFRTWLQKRAWPRKN